MPTSHHPQPGSIQEEPESGLTSKSKPYHHGDLRAALIQAGLDILAEEGAHALTLRAAARRAGVSHTAPYRHFQDKEALLAAIAEEGFKGLAVWLVAARSRAKGAYSQLEETAWAYVRYALEHSAHFRVMFSGALGSMARYPGLRKAAGEAFGVLVSIIEDGQASGALAPGDARQRAVARWAHVHGLAFLLLDQQVPRDVRAAYDDERLVRLSVRETFAG